MKHEKSRNDAARHENYHIVHAVRKDAGSLNREDFRGKNIVRLKQSVPHPDDAPRLPADILLVRHDDDGDAGVV